MRFLGENEITRAKANKGFAKDVVANLQGVCLLERLVEQPSWLLALGAKHAPDCVSMENGVLDIVALLRDDAECFKPHSPAFFSCVTLPYRLDLNAKCPRWQRYLDEVQPNADVQDFLQEWCGYCLTDDTSLHKFVILEGDSRHGKSVFCKVLRALLGRENVSAVPLEAFAEKFALSHTIGKLANIVEEIGPIDKMAEGHLKAFVGASEMTLDRKHKEAVTVEPTARLVFATNNRPRVTDRSKGVWERLVLVPFPIEIPLGKRDPHLAEKLYEELSGIFNWAVFGLDQLRKRGHFVEPDVCAGLKEDYKLEVNPARAFIEDSCEVCEQGEIEKGELYRLYVDHCKDGGYVALNECHFGREVARWYRDFTGRDLPEPVRRRVGNQRARFYQGIRQVTDETGGGPYGPGKSVSLLHTATEK